jgi:hypothetical protein
MFSYKLYMLAKELIGLLGKTKSGTSAKFETRLTLKPVGGPGALFGYNQFLSYSEQIY